MNEPYKHWMYNLETGEGVLFNSVDEYNPEKWANTPALCNKVEDVEVVLSERDMLKKEASELGLTFPSNVKTEKLMEMISEETERQYKAQSGN